jgi:Methyltransferase domain
MTRRLQWRLQECNRVETLPPTIARNFGGGVPSSSLTFAAAPPTMKQPSARSMATSRRRRPRFVGYREILPPSSRVSDGSGGLAEAYQHGEESMDAYLKKTSLSPWVPLPDAACRKLFDLAQAVASDIHVDLGAGDGRINFHAIDYGVGKSIGIDVDEGILKLARERMAKRHPPPNMEFIVADLLDETNPVWEKVRECTILSMHLADTALEKFRPILERKLAGLECKILTAGYEMPGWESTVQEVVLGTQIHLYRWGSKADYDRGFSILSGDDDILKGKDKPKGMLRNALESKKFQGSKIIDRTRKGQNPLARSSPDSDDDEEEDGLTSDEEEDESDGKEKEKPEPKRKKQSRGCQSKSDQ